MELESLLTSINVKFPLADGSLSGETPLPFFLIMVANRLEDAEGIAPTLAAGTGITAIHYNDLTQILTVNATMPLDVGIHTTGDPLLEVADYVAPMASWVDWMG